MIVDISQSMANVSTTVVCSGQLPDENLVPTGRSSSSWIIVYF